MELNEIISRLAIAIRKVDASRPIEAGKPYRPGVGPLRENTLLRLIANEVTKNHVHCIMNAPYPNVAKNRCDIVVNDEWALEVKIARPFGDNGEEAENWSVNVLHPYRGNTSAIGDGLKLKDSGFKYREGIVVVGYEHHNPLIRLDAAIRGFELLATGIVGLKLSECVTEKVQNLIHPVHQTAILYGWEILTD